MMTLLACIQLILLNTSKWERTWRHPIQYAVNWRWLYYFTGGGVQWFDWKRGGSVEPVLIFFVKLFALSSLLYNVIQIQILNYYFLLSQHLTSLDLSLRRLAFRSMLWWNIKLITILFDSCVDFRVARIDFRHLDFLLNIRYYNLLYIIKYAV